MCWLPSAVLTTLDGLVSALGQSGYASNRAEVISALALRCDPSTMDLRAMVKLYKATHTPAVPRRPRPPSSRPLAMKLPSPISLRIDGLVEELRRSGERSYRHQVIGSLIAGCEEDAATLEALCEAFRQAEASAAALPGQPQRRVLSLAKPPPGARQPV